MGIGAQSRRRNQLDESSLNIIADTTGGRYFRARNPLELQQIYAELDRLEPMPEEQTFRPTRNLSYWPLSLGLFFSILMALTTLWSSNTQTSAYKEQV